MEGEPWAAFSEMLAMDWPIADIGHAKRHVYTVQWVDQNNPISRGLPPTFVANDELYHKIRLRPSAHVLATAYDDPQFKSGTGKQEPVVWTVPYGQGRVVMTVLGHDLLAMTQPGFMDLLARGDRMGRNRERYREFAWACTADRNAHQPEQKSAGDALTSLASPESRTVKADWVNCYRSARNGLTISFPAHLVPVYSQ